MARLLMLQSHKSALVVLLKEDAPDSLYTAVQDIRRVGDKQYTRWPPHITMWVALLVALMTVVCSFSWLKFSPDLSGSWAVHIRLRRREILRR